MTHVMHIAQTINLVVGLALNAKRLQSMRKKDQG